MENVFNIPVLLSIIGALVVVTNIIVQVLKNLTWDVSMVLTLVAFFAYCQICSITVEWYMVVAAVVVGFLTSYAAMFGFDKLKESITQMKQLNSK